ncbi:Kinesin-like protein kif22, partial [Perkinsus olseni]
SGHHCDPATRDQAQPDTGRSVRTYHDGPSSVIEDAEREDGVLQISPSDIFHARLEMLASQREAHAVPSAPAVPRDTRLRRLDSLFPELAVDRAPALHSAMEDIIDGSDNLENGHMNNGQVKDEDACKVCYERAIDTVLVPCGHFVVCSVCVLRLDDTDKQCPICRTAYQLAQKIFKLDPRIPKNKTWNKRTGPGLAGRLQLPRGPSSHVAGVGSVAGSPRDAISGLKANVMVCARVRPLFGCGAEGTAQCVITASDKKRIVLEDPRHRELPKEFLFDHVFDSTVTTSTIFKTHVARGIDAAVLSHVPCTVFAHGASGSGKTFTMQVKGPGGLFPQGLVYGRLVYRGRELADLTSGLAKIREALETRLNM